MHDLALFAGAGGGILAAELLGDRTVCAVELDPYAASILVRRQNDGHLQPFPVWDDVRTFDGRPWRGVADCVSGGFPCQDISIAGTGDGLDGERSGLWREFARVVREVEPAVVRVENSTMLTSRGLGIVLGDLAALGFNARWDVLSAADLGAPHLRERLWIVAAHPDRKRQLQPQWSEPEVGRRSCDCADGDAVRAGLPMAGTEQNRAHRRLALRAAATADRWPAEPGLVRMVHGVAHRVHRIRALGNGQVPRVAAAAWEALAT